MLVKLTPTVARGYGTSLLCFVFSSYTIFIHIINFSTHGIRIVFLTFFIIFLLLYAFIQVVIPLSSVKHFSHQYMLPALIITVPDVPGNQQATFDFLSLVSIISADLNFFRMVSGMFHIELYNQLYLCNIYFRAANYSFISFLPF